MISLLPLCSTALLIQWYHHYQRPGETLVWIRRPLLLPPSSQPFPSAGHCRGEASGGGAAARPEFPPCGHTPRRHTACCVAPCRRTLGWCCGSSSCGTRGSSAGWRPCRRGSTCTGGRLNGSEKSSISIQVPLFLCLWVNIKVGCYLYACARVSWGRRCHWSLSRRSCTGVSWSHYDTWRVCLTCAGTGKSSGKSTSRNNTVPSHLPYIQLWKGFILEITLEKELFCKL